MDLTPHTTLNQNERPSSSFILVRCLPDRRLCPCLNHSPPKDMKVPLDGNIPSVTNTQLEAYNQQFPKKQRSSGGLAKQFRIIRELFVRAAREMMIERGTSISDPDSTMRALKGQIYDSFVNQKANALASALKNKQEHGSKTIQTHVHKYIKGDQHESVPVASKMSATSNAKRQRPEHRDNDEGEELRKLKKQIVELRDERRRILLANEARRGGRG